MVVVRETRFRFCEEWDDGVDFYAAPLFLEVHRVHRYRSKGAVVVKKALFG